MDSFKLKAWTVILIFLTAFWIVVCFVVAALVQTVSKGGNP